MRTEIIINRTQEQFEGSVTRLTFRDYEGGRINGLSVDSTARTIHYTAIM